MKRHSQSPALLLSSILYTIIQLLSCVNLLKTKCKILSWERSPSERQPARRCQPLCPLSPFTARVWKAYAFYEISNKISQSNLRMSHLPRSKMYQMKENYIFKKCSYCLQTAFSAQLQLNQKGLTFFNTWSSHTQKSFNRAPASEFLPHLTLCVCLKTQYLNLLILDYMWTINW